MGASLTPIGPKGDHERIVAINDRVAPGVGAKQVREGTDTFGQCGIATTDTQQSAKDCVVGWFGQTVPDG